MDWQIIVALAVAVPVILLPVVLVWGINAGGLAFVLKRLRARQAAREPEKQAVAAK